MWLIHVQAAKISATAFYKQLAALKPVAFLSDSPYLNLPSGIKEGSSKIMGQDHHEVLSSYFLFPLAAKNEPLVMVDNRGAHIVISCWALTLAATTLLLLRIYCKLWRGKGLWWDDHLLCLSCVSNPND